MHFLKTIINIKDNNGYIERKELTKILCGDNKEFSNKTWHQILD